MVPAVKIPPFKNPPDLGGILKTVDPPDTIVNWHSCSQAARDVINYMVKITPVGAPRMWRSGPEVRAVQLLLDDGIPVEDLLELAEGAAVLIAAGEQAKHWWFARNVFGPKTLSRWAGDIAAYEARQEAAVAREAELAELEKRTQEEREAARAAPKPKVADLELHRLAAACMAQVRGRSESDQAPAQQAELGVVQSASGRPTDNHPPSDAGRTRSADRDCAVTPIRGSGGADVRFELGEPPLQRFDPGAGVGSVPRVRELLPAGGDGGGARRGGSPDSEAGGPGVSGRRRLASAG